jgi:acetoacetyl-CoA synthetase
VSPSVSTGAEIRFATAEDIEPCCRLLESSFPRTSLAFWRGMMGYPWLAADEKPHYGAVLSVDGEICGFNGALYANRMVDGRVERFGSGYGWCVRPEYRRYSISLLKQLLGPAGAPDMTWTNLTCRGDLVPLFRKLGYELADERKLVSKIGPGTVVRGRAGSARVVPEDEVTEALLGPDVYRLYQDHIGRTVQRVVFEAGGKACLVVTKRGYLPTGGYPGTELHYVSDRSFFAEHFERIKLRLLMRDKTLMLHGDERLFGFAPKGAGTLPATALFRSQRVTARDIDALYTELVILP